MRLIERPNFGIEIHRFCILVRIGDRNTGMGLGIGYPTAQTRRYVQREADFSRPAYPKRLLRKG